MLPDGVVMHAPALGQHAQFLDRVEDFSIQKLIAQLAVEQFTVAVFPRRSWLDVECFRACILQPLTQCIGYELSPLSERICSGTPRITIALANTSITL